MSRIMIIEDNENLKKELIEFLSRYGYDSYGVEDYKNVVNIIFHIMMGILYVVK